MTDQLKQLRETFGFVGVVKPVEKRRFDESMVERWPSGDERGGQFAPKDGAGDGKEPRRSHIAHLNTTIISHDGFNENMGGFPFTDEASMEEATKKAGWVKNETRSAKKKAYVSRWIKVSGDDFVRLESVFSSYKNATVHLQMATKTGEGDNLKLGQKVSRPDSSAIPHSTDVVSWVKNDVWDKPSRVG